MLLSTIVSYLPYAAVTAFTPGPNNIVALYAIGQNGWRKGKNTIFGISAGFLAVMLICAAFCYELATYLPSVFRILKFAGAIYIFWLAIHVARSKPEGSSKQKVSFWTGVFLQFANVKIIMYALTAYAGYVLPISKDPLFLIAHAICFTLVGVAGTVTWALAGGILQKFLAKYYRPFNLAMGLILGLCGVQLLFDL